MISRTLDRLRAHLLPAISLLVASSIAVALAAVIPIYTRMSGAVILDEAVQNADDASTAPFSFFFATDPGIEPVTWSVLADVDSYLTTEAVDTLGVPGASVDARLVSRSFTGPEEPVVLSSVDRFDELTTVVEGRRPNPESESIEVLVSASLTERFPLGNDLVLIDEALPATDTERTLSISVVGVWEPEDRTDQRWIVSPSVMASQLIIDATTFIDRLGDDRPGVVATAQWTIIGDTSRVTPTAVASLPSNTDSVAAEVRSRSPLVALTRDASPVLADVDERRNDLASTLRASAVPAALAVMVFVSMVLTFNTQQRQTELAVRRSRGLPLVHTMGSIVAEVAVVVTAAVALGALGALALAQLMIRSTAFLTLGPAPVATPLAQQISWGPAVAVAVALVLGQSVLLIGPSRRTIVDHQRNRGRLADVGRSAMGSFDLLVIGAVGVLLLQRRSLPISDQGIRDPWIVALPAAAGLAAALVVVRLLPPLADQAARLLDRSRSVAGFLAAQRMARSATRYRLPVVLIVVACSLSAFVASLSLTLEQQLIDRTYLAEGADHVIVDISPGRPTATPISRFEEAPGVAAVTRTFELDGRFGETRTTSDGVEVIALDPTTFADATHWDSDYDDQPLRELLTGLSVSPDAVLISSTLADERNLGIGDRFRYSIAARFDPSGEPMWLDTGGVVAGVADRFPRWSADVPLVIVRSDTLIANVEIVDRTTTLVRMTDPTAPLMVEAAGLRSSASAVIEDIRAQPERQAVFAVLTATFVVTMAVALLSLVLQTMSTFRERSLDVGVLRAMGVTRRGVRVLLGFDFLVIAVVGVVVGSVIGIGVGQWLIPGLVGGLSTSPPTTVNWPAVLGVAGSFVGVAIAVTIAVSPILARRQVFEALKLGETQ